MASRVTNIALSETGITFKRVNGHSHDGVNSTLIDTTKYSLFDFTPALPSSSGDPRQLYRNDNLLLIKKFIVDTIEERVLNPQGIAIKANTITAREIVSGTITSDQLSANLILVNNIIQSNNYTAGSTGWYISYDGSAEFSNVVIRGTVISNTGSIGGWTINNSNITSNTGNTILNSNGFIQATSGSFTGRVETTAGNLGGWTIDSSGISNIANIGGTNYTSVLNISSGLLLYGLYNSLYASAQVTPGRITCYGESSQTTILGTRIDTGNLFSSQGVSTTTVSCNSTANDSIASSGGVTVANGKTIRAVTSFATTGSSTTARVSQGDVSGFDIIARPGSLRDLKENIVDIENAIDIIKSLRPRKYNFKIDAFSKIDPLTNKPWTEEAKQFNRLNHKYGFIVEEVFEARPDLVSYTFENKEDESPNYLDFSKWKPSMWEDIDVVVLSVKAIQELNDKIEQLESRLKAVEDV